MNIEMFAKAMKMLGQAYGEEYDKETIKLWYEFFKNYNFDELREAIREQISTSEYKPTIASLKKLIAKNRLKNQPSAEDMWNHVIDLVKKYGSYKELEAYKEMDGKTEYAVRSIGGFIKLCQSTTSENIWNKKEFVEIYNRQVEKQIEVALIGSSVMEIGEKNYEE